jgi:cation diffusion facilitator CzcD-associated flavoprotein CzcO
MPSMKNESKEIIVIGSGFGGLSAAIRLASAGHQGDHLRKTG